MKNAGHEPHLLITSIQLIVKYYTEEVETLDIYHQGMEISFVNCMLACPLDYRVGPGCTPSGVTVTV